jgi:hypothetical protein
MKFPIAWHKQNLANFRKSLLDKEIQLARLKLEVDGHRADVIFAAQQIEEAEKRGVTEFDRDRFMVKRKKTNG